MKKMEVSGDIGAKRHDAASAFFKRKIKAAGKGNMTGLSYRKPKIEGGAGPRAV